jgi:serine-type D-Ala-D-Ala carboxypeptidase/endopeptidase (penicillin-binding protein 4)
MKIRGRLRASPHAQLRARCHAWSVNFLVLCLMTAVAAPSSAQSLPNSVLQAMRNLNLPVQDVGVYVVPLGGGQPLLNVNADEALNPASTMKLLTTYAALSRLGADYRWKTRVYLRGELRDGVLNGDLILQGGGDPKLVIEDLVEIIARMREAGLREIVGNLVLDDGVFSLDDRSVEQIDGDSSQPYNVRPHGMLLNFKATKFVITPRADSVDIVLDPPLADVSIDNEVRSARGRCRYGAGGLVIRDNGTDQKPVIKVSGTYSSECGEQNLFAAVLTHRQFAHAFFKAAWLAAGGAWSGKTRIERGAAQGASWFEWTSPRTLGEVVLDINKFSNNVMARQVLLQSTAVENQSSPTIEDARSFLHRWLGRNGLKFPELYVENGSGLSRNERISAEHLARLLIHMSRSAYADLLRESLPRVGMDGTMKSRLQAEPITGRAWIKTGSLNDVRAIAGYVDAASGKRYALVMLINGPRAERSAPAQDELLRWVYANG